MATYVIGDVQGCFDSLQKLITHLDFSPSRDHLIFAGDMVNRGPKSLDTLRAIIALDNAAQCVLGNHDLYLLMCASGGRQLKNKDTFVDILTAPDSVMILEWLAQQPLILQHQEFTVVHAGLLPQWTMPQALTLGDHFSQALIDVWNPRNLRAAKHFFEALWSNTPNVWSDTLTDVEKLRVTVNGMTRTRLLDKKGRMDFTEKGELEKIPSGWYPWFQAPHRKSKGHQMVCGHWSALGLHIGKEISHIDTGCAWGGKLTALRLPDRAFFQVGAVENLKTR